MRRMKCIGAQFVDMTALTAPPAVEQTQCRRNSGIAEHRTFVTTTIDLHAPSSLQMPLFQDPQARARH